MLFLHGLGHFHPENEIDNAFLEALDIGTSDQWILDRVGIKSRRTVLPLDYIRATKNRDLRGAAEAALYSNAEIHFLEMMGLGLPDHVLIVQPENMTRVVDFSDRSTAVLFGDATSAAVVSTKVPSRVRCVHSTFQTSPAGCDEVTIPRAGFFRQNGAVVQKFAIKQMSALFGEIQGRVGPDRE